MPARCPWLWPLVVLFGACATESVTVRETAAAAPAQPRSRYTVRAASDADGESGGVDLRAERGFISQEAAEDAIKQQWRALVHCYDQAGPARDFASGAVKLRFSVDLGGGVASVHVLESRLGSHEVERCLTTVARTIAFPAPQGGRASVEYSLEFRSTGEITVIDLPAGELDGRITAWLPQLAADCKQLGVDQLEATLYIEPRGVVRSVGFASPAPIEPATADCLSASLRRWNVPVAVKRGLGRATLALRNQDLLHPPAPPKHERRSEHGRRPPRGRARH
jgi:hypothetical protein